VPPDAPIASATPINHPDLPAGLVRGDRIISIDGHQMHSFQAILPEIAMAKKSTSVIITIEREGFDTPIDFEAFPVKSPFTGLLDVGLNPSYSTTLINPKSPKDRRLVEMSAHDFGMGTLEPGDTLVSANDQPLQSPFDLIEIAQRTPDQPLNILVDRAGKSVGFTLAQVPSLQTGSVVVGSARSPITHLLGLTGVLMVHPNASQEDIMQGLKPGDIFARIDHIDYPSRVEGISTIQANKGKELDVIVLRKDESDQLKKVNLSVKVGSDGRVGFLSSTTTTHTNLVARPPSLVRQSEGNQAEDASKNTTKNKPVETYQPPASSLIEYPGSRITKIGQAPISTLRDVQNAIVSLTNDAFVAGQESFSIPITLVLPLPLQPDGSIPTATTRWTLSRADIEQVRALGTTLPGGVGLVSLFEVQQIKDKATSPIAAISRGVSESRRVMLQTYLTFLRLFQGSVHVEQLKGPVGIAHLGTQIASQGIVWVFFFMALISINLAVINFLPLPIVDGGQFLMLVYEWIRGRPVPVVVQNAATMAGLVLIGTIFLYVTFNDVKAIFGI